MEKKCHIVTAPASEDTKVLERKIKELWKKGWSLSGPLQYLQQPNDKHLFAQVMVKDGTNTFTDCIIITSTELTDLYTPVNRAKEDGFQTHTRDWIKFKKGELYYQCMVK